MDILDEKYAQEIYYAEVTGKDTSAIKAQYANDQIAISQQITEAAVEEGDKQLKNKKEQTDAELKLEEKAAAERKAIREGAFQIAAFAGQTFFEGVARQNDEELAQLEDQKNKKLINETEETAVDNLHTEIEALDAKIERAEKTEAQVLRAAFSAATPQPEVLEQEKIQQRYSISKLVRESMTGRLTGLEAEMSQQAASDLKNAGVGVRGLAQIPGFILRNTSTIGGTNVPGQSNTNVLEALVPTPILEQAGANVLRGLAGNINLPSLNDGTDIINETASATGAAAIAARQLSPQRVASRITWASGSMLSGIGTP